MFTKKALSVAASLALAEQALAFNAHRHLHADKRAVKVNVVTNYVTVTVWDGESVPAATPTPAAEPVVEAQPSPSTTTSTSIVVVPTPTPVAPVPTTTLVTSVAPKSEAAAQDAAMAIAAVPSSSSQAAAATSAVKASSTTGKRGLAYNDASLVSNFFNNGQTCTNCGWAYNWDSKSNGLSASVEFVPMLWGPIDIHTKNWTNEANAALASGSTHLLSFNECDMPSQCNLDAATAAQKHKDYMNQFEGKARIGAPAISNSNLANQGLEWLTAFMAACGDSCAIDFCVTHWYSPSDAAQTLFDHIEAVYEACGKKPVWLTEFAPFGSEDQINSFVQTNIPKLDAMEHLERYSYFMVSEGVLTSGTGLSTLGKTYASA